MMLSRRRTAARRGGLGGADTTGAVTLSLRRTAAGGAVLAVLCAAAVSAAVGPARAQDGDAQASSRACPDSIEAAPFTDVSSLDDETRAAIDCVAHYGVSRGTTATTFSPAEPVTRAQMARFLMRTAEALGLSLPENPSAPFGDIASLDAEVRTAIARLYELEITKGSSAETFDPAGTVSRGQMALFIHRMLTQAQVPLGETATPFADLGDPDSERAQAAGQLAALRIMPGVAADRFGPQIEVTRADMALFLARSLQHGNASPVRLTIEIGADWLLAGGSTTAVVTASKPNGDPYPGLLVDVFAVQSDTDPSGCLLDPGARINGLDAGTSVDCRIDPADPRTDSSGRVVVGLAHSPVWVTDTVYAWTGDEGEAFDAVRVRSQASASLRWQAPPTQIEVKAPEGPVQYGKTASITARLMGSRLGNQLLVMTVTRDGVVVYSAGAPASGSRIARFSYTAPNPGGGRSTTDEVKVFWDRNRNGVHDGPAELSGERTVTWN